jgi:uncharacterized protein YbjT (DUF2867 family)
VARSSGVTDIARADLRDENAVRRALDGVGGVFYIPPKFLPDEAEIGVRLVDLAAEAGVDRLSFGRRFSRAVNTLSHGHKIKRVATSIIVMLQRP